MVKIDLIDESVRFNIKLENNKDQRRESIFDFLLPVKKEIDDKINGFCYSFNPDLQIDIRVDDENKEEIKKYIKEKIAGSNFLDSYTFIDDPWRAGWGETKKDKKALILGKEISAELALTITAIKYNEDTGKDIGQHGTRHLHIFLNQLGILGEEETKIYLEQLTKYFKIYRNLSDKEHKKIQEEIENIIDKS